jgi:preprotein translocase subunit SecG
MLQTIVLLAHLIVASLIIVLVLLQRGKGADAGTGFGAGASGTVFGSRGTSSFFSRLTAVLASLFFATSLALAYFATQVPAPESLLEGSILEESAGGLDNSSAELPEINLPAVDEPASELPAIDIESDPEFPGLPPEDVSAEGSED